MVLDFHEKLAFAAMEHETQMSTVSFNSVSHEFTILSKSSKINGISQFTSLKVDLNLALLAFDGIVITLADSRLRMKNLGHNFGLVRFLVYFPLCVADHEFRTLDDVCDTCCEPHVSVRQRQSGVNSSNQQFSQNMLNVYAAYSAIIVQKCYAFVFYVVSFCCDDPLFGPVAFKNG